MPILYAVLVSLPGPVLEMLPGPTLQTRWVSKETPASRTRAPGTSQPVHGEADDAVVILDDDGKELGSAPKSRKKQSAVWNFFGPRYTSAKDGRVCVKCRLCEEEFAYVNTTNMYNHLVRKHKGDVLQDLISGKSVRALPA